MLEFGRGCDRKLLTPACEIYRKRRFLKPCNLIKSLIRHNITYREGAMAVERIGTEGADIIMVQAGDLPGGIFDGRGGTDTLQLTGDTTGPWALNFNLGAVSTLTNFEIVRGTTTTDIIKLTS